MPDKKKEIPNLIVDEVDLDGKPLADLPHSDPKPLTQEEIEALKEKIKAALAGED